MIGAAISTTALNRSAQFQRLQADLRSRIEPSHRHQPMSVKVCLRSGPDHCTEVSVLRSTAGCAGVNSHAAEVRYGVAAALRPRALVSRKTPPAMANLIYACSMLWELRVALSLARLRMSQNRHHEVRQLLAPVYDRFTEGFDTPALCAARALLDGVPR